MLKTTRRNTLRLFIFSTSIERVKSRSRELTLAARQASFERDYSRVVLAAGELVELGLSEGRYFQALALSQQGKGYRKQADEIFSELTDCNQSHIKAASFLALGVSAFQRGDEDEAYSFLTKSTQYSIENSLTSNACQTLRAQIAAERGNYEKSFEIYSSTLPRILAYAKIYPAYVGMELNNLAYDLSQVGHLEIANKIISGVVASPQALLYPEWSDTHQEIHKRLNTPRLLYNTIPYQFARNDMEFTTHRDKFTNNIRPPLLTIYVAGEILDKIELPRSPAVTNRILKRFMDVLELLNTDNGVTVGTYRNGALIYSSCLDYKHLNKLNQLITDTRELASPCRKISDHQAG